MQSKRGRVLVAVGLVVALASIACSVVVNLADSSSVQAAIGIGLCPALLTAVLCTSGAVLSWRAKDRAWAGAGGAGVVVSIVGCGIALLTTIGSIRGGVRDAKLNEARRTIANLRHGETAYFQEDRIVGIGIVPTVEPRAFIGGGRGTHASCCPIGSCRAGRTFSGSPWSELHVTGSDIPAPWTFEIEASGSGTSAVARIIATADLACDGHPTRVTQTLRAAGEYEVTSTDFVVEGPE